MDVKFYCCKHCGNVAMKPYDRGVSLVCCGETMEELSADTVDAAVEKHVPAASVDGNKVHVEVGAVLHPMTAEHRIAFICLVTNKTYQAALLSADDEAKADFVLAEGDVPVKVYEYCNLHGLWAAEL